MLEAFGLDGPAERLYRVAVAHPGVETSSAAAAVGLSWPDAQYRVAQLSQLGLISLTGTSITVLDPEFAIAALISREDALIDARRHALAGCVEAVAQLAQGFRVAHLRDRSGDDLGLLEVALSQLHLLAVPADRSLLGYLPAPAGAHEAAKSAAAATSLAQLGVQLRCMVPRGMRDNRLDRSYASLLGRCGAEVRLASALPAGIVLLGRRLVITVAVRSLEQMPPTMVCDVDLGECLHMLLARLWESSSDPQHAEGPLSSAERSVLECLARGMKDEAGARLLDMSVRKFRGHVADVLQRLGAHSRFEAAVLILEKGWL